MVFTRSDILRYARSTFVGTAIVLGASLGSVVALDSAGKLDVDMYQGKLVDVRSYPKASIRTGCAADDFHTVYGLEAVIVRNDDRSVPIHLSMDMQEKQFTSDSLVVGENYNFTTRGFRWFREEITNAERSYVAVNDTV